jgi:aminopeptidase N
MTDTMGALHALNDRDSQQRRRALQAFHDTWRHDPLVLDKWFALNASSSLPDTLETIEQLLDHPLFSIRNPNRVRAVIGTFAQRNPINFHHKSGAGYRFVATQVLRLDPLNPQVAARLVRSFARWKQYDPVRQRLMQAELRQIVDTAGISRDVFEIAFKSLA